MNAGKKAILVGLAAGILFAVSLFARADETKPLAPRFLSGAALYSEGHLVAVVFGKTMFLNIRDCLEDTRHSVEKAAAHDGSKVIGLCVPIPTLNAADLVPPTETDSTV